MSRSFRVAVLDSMIMDTWLWLLLLTLTIYRVTRFIVMDAFPPFAVPRTWLINWWEPDLEWLSTHPEASPHWGSLGRSLRYLVQCPWCMGFWVSLGGVWAIDYWYRDVPEPWFVIASAAAITGLLSTLEDKLSS